MGFSLLNHTLTTESVTNGQLLFFVEPKVEVTVTVEPWNIEKKKIFNCPQKYVTYVVVHQSTPIKMGWCC